MIELLVTLACDAMCLAAGVWIGWVLRSQKADEERWAREDAELEAGE